MAQSPPMKSTRAQVWSGDLSHDAIQTELSRILAHREFQATDKMRSFLSFVVEETLAGRAEQLKGFTIATQVFGRGADFDAAHDPIVRIQAGRLRRALERYYLVAGGRDPIHIEIPKGRYVPHFAEKTILSDAKPDARPYAKGGPARVPVGPSVAVLPLENLSADPDQNFFTVGLAEDLVTELNRFQDLIIIPCQRTTLFPESGADPEQLGRRAGARFLLGGTLRRDADTVKVAMYLIDSTTNRQVWARAYKRPLAASNLIATQEEIARSVVAAIGSEYGIIARRLSAESRKKPPADLDTYEAMLRYYSYQISPNPDACKACFVALQRAVEREPKYGPAWSALATLHCQLYSFDIPGFGESLDTALRYARHGVFLEPGSQIGRLILSYATYLAEDLDTFHQEIETTLTLNPNSPYHLGTAGYFHVMVGEFERGLPLLDRATAANPYHPKWFHTAYFIEYFRHREFERALLEIENHKPVSSYWLPVVYTAVLGKLGRTGEAAAHIEKLQRMKPDFSARARELMRRTLKIDAVIDEVIDGLRSAGLPVEDAR